MSFRFMRVFVIFDLPIGTAAERKAYRKFRKYLIKTGFIMMQESVYSKLCLNATAAKVVNESVKKHKPDKGLVELMIVTEKQYASIEYIVGSSDDEFVATTDRLVIV